MNVVLNQHYVRGYSYLIQYRAMLHVVHKPRDPELRTIFKLSTETFRQGRGD